MELKKGFYTTSGGLIALVAYIRSALKLKGSGVVFEAGRCTHTGWHNDGNVFPGTYRHKYDLVEYLGTELPID